MPKSLDVFDDSAVQHGPTEINGAQRNALSRPGLVEQPVEQSVRPPYHVAPEEISRSQVAPDPGGPRAPRARTTSGR